MAAKTWKPVRLTSDTLELLDAIKTTLQRSHERGQRTIPFGPKGEITNEYVVQTIARAWLSHRDRSNRKNRRRPMHPLPPAIAGLAAADAAATAARLAGPDGRAD